MASAAFWMARVTSLVGIHRTMNVIDGQWQKDDETTHETYFKGIPRNIALFSDPPVLPPAVDFEPETVSTDATEGRRDSRLCENRDTLCTAAKLSRDALDEMRERVELDAGRDVWSGRWCMLCAGSIVADVVGVVSVVVVSGRVVPQAQLGAA